MTDKQRNRRHGMVRWYNPFLLLRAGIRSMTTTAVGQIVDYRELQAALDPLTSKNDYGIYDYSNTNRSEDLWIDYVADIGDGWDSTCAIAKTLAAEKLDLDGVELTRGRILVMGGDQVYPDPSNDAYLERTINPYREACSGVAHFTADLFALPGNHDWYDGLREFSEIYCSSARRYKRGDEYSFDCWQTRQSRSYFALKLPNRWWLCGIDVQLDNRLNPAQQEYFQIISEKLIKPGDRIVLCAANPSWVSDSVYDPVAIRTLADIVGILGSSGAVTKLVLTGDLHHYSHYEPQTDGPHLVTCGGGGAFMHPTHLLEDQAEITWKNGITDKFKLGAVAPGKARSRLISYRNLFFSFRNWEFSILIGLVYSLLAWFLETRQVEGKDTLSNAFREMIAGHEPVLQTLGRFFETIPKSPEFALMVFLLGAALVAFNVNGSKIQKLLLGIGHTFVHFFGLIAAFCFAAEVTGRLGGDQLAEWWSVLVFLFTMVLSGSLIGGLIFGLFLIISLNVFGFQWTNSFSSLRITNHKCFIRMRFDREGNLSVFPVKLEQCGRVNSNPELIEKPFTIQ